jgi:hypothetical protein
MKFTKNSILISSLILALGVAVSWRDSRQLAFARVNQSQLAAKLAAVGSHVDLSQAGTNREITKRPREKREGNHQESTSDLIALIREITAGFKNGSNLDPASSAKLRSLENLSKSLDAAQWKALLAGIHADQVFEEFGDTNEILSSLMMMMGIYFRDSGQPQTILTLAKQFPLLFKDNEKGLAGMRSCMALWAKQDSTSAVAWIRKNHVIFPELVNGYDISDEMLLNVAMKDPDLAFQLIGELGIENPNNSVRSITMFAKTAESRTAILGALHRYVAAMPSGEERDQALNEGVTGLIKGVILSGFEVGTEWINHTEFTPDQYMLVFDIFAVNGGGADGSSQWIDWLIPRLPPEQVTGKVSKMVTSWAKQDYKSAGEWISGQANGVVKNAGIDAYSQVVAAYEPAVAVQWAMTLPPGEDRENALQGVYKNWLGTDPGGKQAFGTQHGLE